MRYVIEYLQEELKYIAVVLVNRQAPERIGNLGLASTDESRS